jgi:hypothetical protein
VNVAVVAVGSLSAENTPYRPLNHLSVQGTANHPPSGAEMQAYDSAYRPYYATPVLGRGHYKWYPMAISPDRHLES